MKYLYAVSFAVIGTSNVHFETFTNAPAAMAAARLAYAALKSVLAPGHELPPSFGQIKQKHIVGVREEPRNKSFVVQVRKAQR